MSSRTKGIINVGGAAIVPVTSHDWSTVYKVNKFGRNETVQSGAAEGVCDLTAFVWPTSTAATTIISTSGTDAPAAAGALTAQVDGLDADYALSSQTLTLNGTTAVAMTVLRRAHRIKVLTAGSGGANVGAINVKSGSTAIASVLATNNQTLMASYTVPANYTAYMIAYYYSINRNVATGQADVRLWARPFGEVFQLKHHIGISTTGSSKGDHVFRVAFPLTEKTDLYLDTDVSANDIDISGGFDLIVVANS